MDVKPQSLQRGAPLGEPLDDRREPAGREGHGSFALFLVQLLLAVLIFRSFIFSPFTIPSESMVPRLVNGDYLLAAKWPYGISANSLPFRLPLPDGRLFPGTPARGDVVIFKHPVDGTDYIKRVIGLPGDTIAVVQGQVVLNGAPLPLQATRDFEIALSPNTACAWGGEEALRTDGTSICKYQRFIETLPGGRRHAVVDFGPSSADNYAPVTVPAGALFVMGDNRDNSQDSRFPAAAGFGVGMVPMNNLVGRASIIAWSTDGSAEWLKPWTWFTAARWDRIGTTL
ncbi:signal peptidase I [Erythrobacter sp. T5W1-R]|uniref:signal peptidase I n=1 Tax=Erythrobacter sp. T5W1-R TaxID=3101752 RepID=UPI002AFF290F|nr:signal peptidase I [Erythrobacter sp. T5W1-R]MEA1619299.1 signal peptidase I [Erythrobacter sp. T5W1-R]